MVYQLGRKHAVRLALLARLLTAVLPAVLLGVAFAIGMAIAVRGGAGELYRWHPLFALVVLC